MGCSNVKGVRSERRAMASEALSLDNSTERRSLGNSISEWHDRSIVASEKAVGQEW
jgi:hypothetical protein